MDGANHEFDAIVVGAGHNGLAAAAMLARSGRKVLVCERRDIVGGLAAREEFHPGFRVPGFHHDSTCVRPRVIEALRLESFGLKRTNPPSIFAPHLSGPGLLLHHDAGAAADEIAAHSDTDAQRYADYRAFIERIAPAVLRLLDEAPPDVLGLNIDFSRLLSTGWSLRKLGRRDMMELLRIAPMCVADWLDEWFACDLLKCTLAGSAIFGTFTGPWSPGNNALLLRHEVLSGGAVFGGPANLIDALRQSAEHFGATIRTGADVSRVRVTDGRVDGVTLSDGEEIDASCVAASCDPKRLFLGLLGRQAVTTKLRLHIESYRMSGTTAKVHLAIKGRLRFACRPDLNVEHARIADSLDDMERAFDAIKYERFSDRPVLDVYVPTVSDPNLAPDGHSVVSIMAHYAPYTLDGGWNDAQRSRLTENVLSILEQYAPGLRDCVVASETLVPPDIEKRYGVAEGQWHHGEHGLDQLIVRPAPECTEYATPIAGLFLCGSGAHPGGGLTCGPGALAADRIIRGA